MSISRTFGRVLFATALAFPMAGCGHAMLPTGAMAVSDRNFSGIDTFATHKPKRSPKRTHEDGSGADAKFLANAAVEGKAPGAFILTAQSKAFLAAESSQADGQRRDLARQIAGNSGVMGAFGQWDGQSQTDKLNVLKQIAEMEGRVMGFQPPPMTTKSGVPSDGTMAYFAPARDGIGSVTLFPAAIAKGDRWAAIATVTHEMRHAYQFQLVEKASKNGIAKGSVDYTLALGFYQADMMINKAGGEDKFSYGDYCHLNNEWDAFATGNMIASIVSKGEADTSGLGFADVQFSASGSPLISLSALAAKAGEDGLLDAVNQAEVQYVKQHQGK